MDTHEVTGTVREIEGKAEKSYGQLKSKARETADELAGIADEPIDSSWDNAMAFVQENPGTALGIGFLVGAGVSALLTYLIQD